MRKLRGIRSLTQDPGLISGRSKLQTNVSITLITLQYAALHHGIQELGSAAQSGEMEGTKHRLQTCQNITKTGQAQREIGWSLEGPGGPEDILQAS